MLEEVKNEVLMAENTIRQIDQKMSSLLSNPDYTDKYKNEQGAKLSLERESTVEHMFSKIDNLVTRTLEQATKAVAIPTIPYDQRNYEATAAAQDIAATKPEQWFKFYKDASESGNIARKQELKRLIDPRINGDLRIEWNNALQEAMTPAEQELDQVKREQKALLGSMTIIKMSLLESIGGISWDTVFKQIQNNADKIISIIE